jgi:hypothetical protein
MFKLALQMGGFAERSTRALSLFLCREAYLSVHAPNFIFLPRTLFQI